MKKNAETGLYDIVIDDRLYEFSKWGAEDSLDTMIDIAGIVGGPLGEAIGKVVSDGGLDKDFDPNVVMTIVESLTKNISGNKAICKSLIKKLSSEHVMCDGKKVNFNEHYRDELGHLFKVVKSALEVQYGNFFAGLVKSLPRKSQKTAKQESISQE